MHVQYLDQKALTSGTISYRIGLSQADMRLFGFLLESIEGLGYHSAGDSPNEMLVLIPTTLQIEFTHFLNSVTYQANVDSP